MHNLKLVICITALLYSFSLQAVEICEKDIEGVDNPLSLITDDEAMDQFQDLFPNKDWIDIQTEVEDQVADSFNLIESILKQVPTNHLFCQSRCLKQQF